MGKLDDALNALYGSNDNGPLVPTSGGDYSWLSGLASAPKKKKEKGIFGGNLLEDALNLVDAAKHAVTEVPVEVGRGIGKAMGAEYGTHPYYYVTDKNGNRQSVDAQGNPISEKQQHAEDFNPGLGEYVQHVTHPEEATNFGDVIAGTEGKGFSRGVLGEHGLVAKQTNPLAISALGLAGDIAVDPLTYLMPAGEVHGAAEAAGHISDQFAEKAGSMLGRKLTAGETADLINGKSLFLDKAALDPATAEQLERMRQSASEALHTVRRFGPSKLTADQITEWGGGKLEKGMQLNFGRLGHIGLTKGEGPLANLSILRHRAQMALGDFLLGSGGTPARLGKWLAKTPLANGMDLENLARSGPAQRTAEGGMSMLDATMFKRIRAVSRNMEEVASNEAARATSKAVNDVVKKHGLKGDAIDETINEAEALIDGGLKPEDASPAAQEMAQGLSDAFYAHAQQRVAGGAATEETLLKQGQYFPSPVAQDAREALVAAGLHPAEAAQGGQGIFINTRRTLWDKSTGVAGIGVDSETTKRVIKTGVKTRAEAEKWAGEEVARAITERAKIAGEEGEAARNFLADHPDFEAQAKKGSVEIFKHGREALVAEAKATGRAVARARAGRALFERGYGIVNPVHGANFTDYGATPEEVARMHKLGENEAAQALDKAAAAREKAGEAEQLAAEGPGEGPRGPIGTTEEQLAASLPPEGNPPPEAPPAGGSPTSPQTPPEGPVAGGGAAAPEGATPVPQEHAQQALEAVKAFQAMSPEDVSVAIETPAFEANLDTLVNALEQAPLNTSERAVLNEIIARRGEQVFTPSRSYLADLQERTGEFNHLTQAGAAEDEQRLFEATQMADKYLGGGGGAVERALTMPPENMRQAWDEVAQTRYLNPQEQQAWNAILTGAWGGKPLRANLEYTARSLGMDPTLTDEEIRSAVWSELKRRTEDRIAAGAAPGRPFMEESEVGARDTVAGRSENFGPPATPDEVAQAQAAAGRTVGAKLPSDQEMYDALQQTHWLSPVEDTALQQLVRGHTIESVRAAATSLGISAEGSIDEVGVRVYKELLDRSAARAATGAPGHLAQWSPDVDINPLNDRYGRPLEAAAPQGPTGPTMTHEQFMAQEPTVDVGAEKRAFDARAKATAESLPPRPPGTFRIYNGGGTNWWTPRISRAMAYGENDLRFLDITREEAAAFKAADVSAATGQAVKGDVAIDLNANPELREVLNRSLNTSQYRVGRAVADARLQDGLDEVHRTIQEAKDFLEGRAAKAADVTGTLSPTDDETTMRRLLSALHEDIPSAFGWRDPLEELSPHGFKPTGGIEKMGSPSERIAAMRKKLAEVIAQHDANPDLYAAEVRSKVEGKLAEDAQKAKEGAVLPYEETVPAPRRYWTYEEKQAHNEARRVIRERGPERGAALKELREAQAEVRRIEAEGPVPVSQDTARSETRARLLQDERDQLAQGLEQKKALDQEQALAEAQRKAHESPIGLAGNTEADNLQQWAERNAIPTDQSEVAQYERGNPDENLQTDKAVTDAIEAHIARLDAQIARLKASAEAAAFPKEVAKSPVTNLDVARAREERAKAAVDEVTKAINDAKAALPNPKTEKFGPVRSGTIVRPVEGSAYDEAVKSYGDAISAADKGPIEPYQDKSQRYAPGQRPLRDFETQDYIPGYEGATTGATQAVDPRVLRAKADQIKAQWAAFGETVQEHKDLRDAFAAYKEQLDRAIPQSAARDETALANTQVDAIGMMANNPAQFDSAVDDIVHENDLVKATRGAVPEEYKVATATRAREAKQLKVVHDAAVKAGDSNAAEVARVKATAMRLQNQADIAHGNARDWLTRWNSLFERNKLHTSLQSLLVQGKVDYLSHRSLAPGLLAPIDAVDAVTAFDKVVFSPEGQSKFADAWHRALHWMRVWQITSPGFHIRNLFGGVFNNALAGVDAASYSEFMALWRKAAKNGIASLSPQERELWAQVTSVLTAGQIGEQALGSPMGRLAGQSGFSKTPWGQLGTHGVLPRVSENVGSNVEFYLRGTLMYDTLKKGQSLESAVEAVNKYHFDYHDASTTEQWIKQNAIPFLTWTRHNVPLQVQMMLENPKVYARFAHFRDELQDRSKADPVVPAYFGDISAIRLPFTTGGGHTYYIPDLPFRDLSVLTGPLEAAVGTPGDTGDKALAAFGEPISQTTPLISGPIEWMLGKQFYKGIPLRNDRGIALGDLHIPNWLAKPLALTPLVKKSGATGRYYITEKDWYIVEKMLPLIGRARRLGGSSEPKQQDKLLAHLISFFAGAQIRTNTTEDQKVANYLSSLETKRKKTIDNGLTVNKIKAFG